MAERIKHFGGAMRREQRTIAIDDHEVDDKGRMSDARHARIVAQLRAYLEASNRVFEASEPFAAELETAARDAIPAGAPVAEPLTKSWYAAQIIQDIHFTRGAIAAGDARLTAQIALRLGTMAQEADLRGRWEETVEKALRMKEAARNAQRKGAATRRGKTHHEWLRRAAELRAKHPTWSRSCVAKAIDNGRWQTVRKKIASLWEQSKLAGHPEANDQ